MPIITEYAVTDFRVLLDLPIVVGVLIHGRAFRDIVQIRPHILVDDHFATWFYVRLDPLYGLLLRHCLAAAPEQKWVASEPQSTAPVSCDCPYQAQAYRHWLNSPLEHSPKPRNSTDQSLESRCPDLGDEPKVDRQQRQQRDKVEHNDF